MMSEQWEFRSPKPNNPTGAEIIIWLARVRWDRQDEDRVQSVFQFLGDRDGRALLDPFIVAAELRLLGIEAAVDLEKNEMRLVDLVRIPLSCGIDQKKMIEQQGKLGGYAPPTEVPIIDELELAIGLYTYCFRDTLKRPYLGCAQNMRLCLQRFEHWLSGGEDFLMGADLAAGRNPDLRKCEFITEEQFLKLLGTNLFAPCQ